MKQSMLLSVFVSLFLLIGCGKDFSEYSSEVSASSMQETVVFHCANLEQHSEEYRFLLCRTNRNENYALSEFRTDYDKVVKLIKPYRLPTKRGK